MAWIMNADENNEVINIIIATGFSSGDTLVLGGGREPSGTTWYWTEYPGLSLEGIPFYEGVTASQGGYALRYESFLPNELVDSGAGMMLSQPSLTPKCVDAFVDVFAHNHIRSLPQLQCQLYCWIRPVSRKHFSLAQLLHLNHRLQPQP